MNEMIERAALAIHRRLGRAHPFGADAIEAEHCRLAARAALEAVREPTREMQRAGSRANVFENKHGDQWGCPGVTCAVESPDDWLDPANAEAVGAFVNAPKCLIGSLRMPADPVWQAMIDTALTDQS